MGQFLEGWSDNSPLSYHTLPPNVNISQISTYNTSRLYDSLDTDKEKERTCFTDSFDAYLSVQDDIFAPAKDASSTDFVPRRL